MATIRHTKREAPDRARAAEIVRLAVGRCARRLRQQAGLDLTPSQAAVLATIARHGPLSPSKLAEVERISRPTVTRLIAKLEAKGLIERMPDPGDGRSYAIKVSETGSALRRRLRGRKEAYLSRLLEGADAGELDVLERAAEVLLRLLDSEER